MKITTLIVMPLAIMFLIAIVNSSTIFTDNDLSTNFNVTRNINQTILYNITAQTNNIYTATYSIFPWIHKDAFTLLMTNVLNTKLGISEGHVMQSESLFDLRKDKGNNLTDSEVYNIIKYDPNLISDLEHLEGYGLRLGGNNLIFVGMFLGACVLVAVLGIRVFGSGISETSISVIFRLLVLFLLWGLLSALTFSLFNDIPYGIGLLIWTVLSFMYGIGGFMVAFDVSGD